MLSSKGRPNTEVPNEMIKSQIFYTQGVTYTGGCVELQTRTVPVSAAADQLGFSPTVSASLSPLTNEHSARNQQSD